MKFIIAKKIGMTRGFSESGESRAITLVSVIPTKISKIMTEDKNGYKAIQIESKVIKNKKENDKKRKNKKPLQVEFRIDNPEKYKVGDEVKINQFQNNDIINVQGIGKGKGFSGVIKRHGFSRGPMSHGSDHHRKPGSIGGMFPQRVVAGKKMPGRMGQDSVTLKNLQIMAVDDSENIIIISGSVPGANKNLIKIWGSGEKMEEKAEEIIEQKEEAEEEKALEEIKESDQKNESEKSEADLILERTEEPETKAEDNKNNLKDEVGEAKIKKIEHEEKNERKPEKK